MSGWWLLLVPVAYVFGVWHGLFVHDESVLFLRGRIHFCDANGVAQQTAPTGNALIAYSPADTDALAKSGLRGTLVRLRK